MNLEQGTRSGDPHMVKVEIGLVAEKNGKGWGITSSSTGLSYGWVPIENAIVRSPEFCKSPLDMTNKGSKHILELETAKLVKVRRVTTITKIN